MNKLVNPIEERFRRVITPFEEFVHYQTTSSILLVGSTCIALIWANSPFGLSYFSLFETHLGIHLGRWSIDQTLHHWINDGLMVLFFFTLGLEIKREVLAGELKDSKSSLLIISAAVGGMVVPAVIYTLFNAHTLTARGWGIPMATDTAFALGILAFLGPRIPKTVITFLVALAIADDIGAVLVIALFYTKAIAPDFLAASFFLLLLLVLFNLVGIRKPLPYFFVGGVLWWTILRSGVHPTIAGILAAFAIPARPRLGGDRFLNRIRNLTETFREKKEEAGNILEDQEQHTVVRSLRDTATMAMTPLQRWESALERPVALLVIPVFALANAGIPLRPEEVSRFFDDSIALGVIFGLVFGKVIGIVLFCWAGLRWGIGRLPNQMTMAHVVGVGLLGGMGFTMSIFIAELSFGTNAQDLLSAKIGILIATVLAGFCGYFWLRFAGSGESEGNFSDRTARPSGSLVELKGDR